MLSKVKDIFKGTSSHKKKKVYHNVRLDNPQDYWEITGELGDGAYGKVYKAQYKTNGKLAALKQVNLEGEDDLESFMIEIDILSECKHPNIVELLEAYHYDGKLWMYLEYCDGGAVDSIMVDLDRPLTESQIALLCRGICQALRYIHSIKVIHRDLKAGNVLLTMDGGVKLADFGVSAKNKNTFDKRGTFIGTPYWLAPEVILCETFIDAKYDYKADIWSLGISLIEFAQMDPPNHEVSPVRVMLKIQKSDPPKLDFPHRWSKNFNDFIAKCLVKDPLLRPDAEELLKHPFLTQKLDMKPIRDLLLEYKAEVVEEEVEEDSEEQDPSRHSTVSDALNNSPQFDSESLASIDKDSTLRSNDGEKLPSPILDDRESETTILSDRRMSKGPAPLPPIISSTHPPPKKGPAPAIPITPTTVAPALPVTPTVATTTTSAVTTPTSPIRSVTESFANATTDSSATSTTTSVSSIVPAPVSYITSPVSKKENSKSPTDSPTNLTDHVTSTPTSANIKTKFSAPIESPVVSSPVESPIVGHPDSNIPKESLVKELSTPSEGQNINIPESHPIRTNVEVTNLDTFDTSRVTVNSLNINKPQNTELTLVIGTPIQPSSNVGKDVESFPIQISLETPNTSIVESNNSQTIVDINIPSSSSPVTVAVSVPQAEEGSTIQSSTVISTEAKNHSHEASDMLLASISSEGTVIVRSPTPTPASDASHIQTTRTENVVTYTVAEADSDPSSSAEISSTLSTVDSDLPLVHSREPETPPPYNLLDAEAQAVFILEAAIDSAMDSTSNQYSDVSGLSSPSSLNDYPLRVVDKSDAKGEVVVVASEQVTEEDGIKLDKFGRKLDESEVIITNSSFLEDEQKLVVEPSSRLEIAIEDERNDDDINISQNEPHISVVAIQEDLINSNESKSPEFIDSVTTEMESENNQLSLTIEGTTIEATDVDEIENSEISSYSSQANSISCSSQANSNATLPITDGVACSEVSSVHISNEDKEDKFADKHYYEDQVTNEGVDGAPLQPIQNGVRRQNSRSSDRSDTDTTSTVGSDKENRHRQEDNDYSESVTLRGPSRTVDVSQTLNQRIANKNLKNKESQESIALKKKTRKRTRRFVIDGVVFTTTTSKVIYGEDEECGTLSSAHLARKQEMRELKLVQRQEQKQFQELGVKANLARQEQEKKFEIEKANLIRNYDTQIENLTRQQKQLVEKAEARQESELKIESKKTRVDQERELKAFRESLKQEWKLLKQEVDLLPKDKRKENFRIRKDHLERDQADREKACLERLNDSHEMALKRLNDKHRKHIALKERQFLEEKHQLLRARESALWDMEERQIQDKHQLAKEQLKDIYFLQRLQMAIRHNVELEQVRRFNHQKEDALLKRQQAEKRQLPKRIRQEMKTREKMFREQIRISMSTLPSHDQEKDQLKRFQEQEKVKYDKERKRAESKHKKQMEELTATMDASIKELVHLQNEKGKLLTEHETYKLKTLDEEYQKELKEWKANLAPRKQKLEEGFERQLNEQEKFYGDYLERGLGLSATPSQSMTSLGKSS